MKDLTGPEWLTCLGDIVSSYEQDLDEADDAFILEESYRVEVKSPPSQFNDRDWRTYRRYVRQEMHRRGLTTPTESPY